MAEDQPSVEEVDPLAFFDERWREPVEGLVYLGKLAEDIQFCGHTFGLRTLLPHEKFAVSQVLQPYRNTIREVDVYQTAHIAMALTMVDDDPDFCPSIGPDIEIFARARLNWVSRRFYDPTIEFLWGRYSLLETQAALVMKELDSLLKGSQPTTLPPWLDSLIAQGNSADETVSDTQHSIPSSDD